MVTLDGAEINISSLTVDQVENLISSPQEELTKSGEKWTFAVICASLNNLQPDTPWTEERVRKELDRITVHWLLEQILSFSGLKFKDPTQGESGAAAPAAS